MSILATTLAALLPFLLNPSGDLNAALMKGDEAFFRMEYKDAIGSYNVALEEYPKNPETLWRLARAFVCMGEVLEGGDRLEACKQAEQYARTCIEQDSTRPEGHSWRAAALGYITLDAGKSEQVKLSHELLREVEIAIQLNPNDDAAYSIKGSFYRALGNVSWFQRQLAALFVGKVPDGGFVEAEAALKKAIALAPDVMRHEYELGILYIDMDRQDEAEKMLEHAATLPIKVAIDRPRLKKIQELLVKLSEK